LILNSSEPQNLRSLAREFGIDLSLPQIRLLNVYLDELCEWNKKTNLTGLTTREEIINELLLDSMIPAAFLPDSGRFLDVGSGAGFPGIPFMICKPELSAHFLEPNSKKVSFLKQVIRLTELNQINVTRGRIEKRPNLFHPKGYHIITARALAHLSQVLKWCCPHLASGGFMVSFHGSQFKDALEDASGIIKKYQLRIHKTIPYILPGKDSQRNILIFMKGR
jgi:16S rRNA (guanine527-N7)-methyltransferase